MYMTVLYITQGEYKVVTYLNRFPCAVALTSGRTILFHSGVHKHTLCSPHAHILKVKYLD